MGGTGVNVDTNVWDRTRVIVDTDVWDRTGVIVEGSSLPPGGVVLTGQLFCGILVNKGKLLTIDLPVNTISISDFYYDC